MTEWDQIVRKHGPCVYQTAWRLVGDADMAEEVVEEVFREARRCDRARRLRAWGAVLCYLAAVRGWARLCESRAAWMPPAEGEDPAAHRLRQALAELPCREAVVFSLRYFGDLAHDQIAEACQLTLPVVTAALHGARARLAALMAGAAAPR